MASGRSNKLTGQIGEFLVAAELGKRGLIATPFAGNVPNFDLIVADQHCRTLPVQVKASNGDTWREQVNRWMQIEVDDRQQRQVYHGPAAIDDPELIYVCVAIAHSPEQHDRFFILNKAELQQICITGYTTWMDTKNWHRPRNFKSMDCRYGLENVAPYEHRWSVIQDALARQPKIVG